jgi:hypothetical protein
MQRDPYIPSVIEYYSKTRTCFTSIDEGKRERKYFPYRSTDVNTIQEAKYKYSSQNLNLSFTFSITERNVNNFFKIKVRSQAIPNYNRLWRMPSSEMWRRVDLVWTDVSEERIAPIFRVEKSASEEPAWAGDSRLLPPAHAGSSRIFLPWRWRRHIPPKIRFTQDL